MPARVRIGYPADPHMGPAMIIRRERAAVAALQVLRAMGAQPIVTHRLPNGLGVILPETGFVHGPAVSVRHERATRPGMDARRGHAADGAYRTLLFMGADVAWRRVYDTGKVHGPFTRAEH